jgi:hypothetical protein
MMRAILTYFFGEPIKPPYPRGRDYALNEIRRYGPDVIPRLLAESSGGFNTTGGEREFDQGINDQIRDYRAQQEEILRSLTC